jgi:hypothetical protein
VKFTEADRRDLKQHLMTLSDWHGTVVSVGKLRAIMNRLEAQDQALKRIIEHAEAQEADHRCWFCAQVAKDAREE